MPAPDLKCNLHSIENITKHKSVPFLKSLYDIFGTVGFPHFTWTPSKILPANLEILITLEKEQVFCSGSDYPVTRSSQSIGFLQTCRAEIEKLLHFVVFLSITDIEMYGFSCQQELLTPSHSYRFLVLLININFQTLHIFSLSAKAAAAWKCIRENISLGLALVPFCSTLGTVPKLHFTDVIFWLWLGGFECPPPRCPTLG